GIAPRRWGPGPKPGETVDASVVGCRRRRNICRFVRESHFCADHNPARRVRYRSGQLSRVSGLRIEKRRCSHREKKSEPYAQYRFHRTSKATLTASTFVFLLLLSISFYVKWGVDLVARSN